MHHLIFRVRFGTVLSGQLFKALLGRPFFDGLVHIGFLLPQILTLGLVLFAVIGSYFFSKTVCITRAPAPKPAAKSRISRTVLFIVDVSFDRHHGKRQSAKEKGDTHQNASHHVALAFGIGQIVQKSGKCFPKFHVSTSLRKNRQTRDEADSGHGSKQVRQSLSESGHSVFLQNISLRSCR